MIMQKKCLVFILGILIVFLLILTVRGNPGNPSAEELNQPHWSDDGPLELSPERGRFALTYSLLEDKTPFFSLPIARFATPDLGYKDGHFVSLFAPGVSFIIIPGYFIGKLFGLSQVGVYFEITIFAILNVFLIRALAIKLGANPLAALLAALTFIFATPALTYAVSLFQHQISTFLILLSLYCLLVWRNFWSNVLVWFLVGISITVDNPNFFLMIPIMILSIMQMVDFQKMKDRLQISFKITNLITLLGLALPLAIFLWFNQVSYGSPFQLAGTVTNVKTIDKNGKPTVPNFVGTDKIEKFTNPKLQQKSAIGFFQTRNILNGFYIHFVSPDRGIIYFTPIILLGIFGAFFINKKRGLAFSALSSVLGINILLYSMWGDPWGGWAFASRYLVPSYAILAIFLAFALTQFRKNLFFLIAFLILFNYSSGVNILGALTSSKNPPKIEILGIEKLSGKEEKYTYERNFQFLLNSGSKSFIYQSLAKNYLTALQYYQLITASVIVLMSVSACFYCLQRERIKPK